MVRVSVRDVCAALVPAPKGHSMIAVEASDTNPPETQNKWPESSGFLAIHDLAEADDHATPPGSNLS